jgi:hypothetical protein
MKASIAAISALLMLGAGGAAAQLETQTDGHHSALTAVDGALVEDAELARWFRALLVGANGRRVKSTVFLFQQSFGGGMLDDLRTSLNVAGLAFVGGAAAKHDDPAAGFVSSHENMAVEIRPYDSRWVADPPTSPWTREIARLDPAAPGGLSGELLETQSILAAINAAGAQSAADDFDAVQSTAVNGGGLARLVDDTTKTHHAILWAGFPDRLGAFSDIASIRAALTRVWRDESFSIAVLFGDGKHKVLPADAGGYNLPGDNNLPADWRAIEATADNLRITVESLASVVDPSDQVLFYATGHGTQILDGCGTASCPKGKVTLGANGGDLAQVFNLSANELATFLERSAAAPSLRISHSGKVKRNAIVIAFNDESLGLLSPTEALTVLSVPKALLGEVNDLQVHSHNPGAVQLQARLFPSGSVGTTPVRDCNRNGFDDTVDFALGASKDVNENRIPDDCESGRIRKPPRMRDRPEHPSVSRPPRPERPERPAKPVRPPRPHRPPGPSEFQ